MEKTNQQSDLNISKSTLKREVSTSELLNNEIFDVGPFNPIDEKSICKWSFSYSTPDNIKIFECLCIVIGTNNLGYPILNLSITDNLSREIVSFDNLQPSKFFNKEFLIIQDNYEINKFRVLAKFTFTNNKLTIHFARNPFLIASRDNLETVSLLLVKFLV